MPETDAERSERTRQVNFRTTPTEYGQLAVRGAVSGLSAVEQVRQYIQEGLRRDAEIPEFKALFDAAEAARQIVESRDL